MTSTRLVHSVVLLGLLTTGSVNLAAQAPGARLKLIPSEPLTEPRFPHAKTEAKSKDALAGAAPEAHPVRLAILDLKPAADPIHLEPDAGQQGVPDQWRTYRRPLVDRFSRDREGIAIRGYDVVAYLEGKALQGRDDFTAVQEGVVWRFASAEHRDLFRREPERYLPEYGGFCAYSIGKGYPATADPRVYAIEGGKLYLFFDPVARAVWEQDLERLVGKGNRVWPRLHRP